MVSWMTQYGHQEEHTHKHTKYHKFTCRKQLQASALNNSLLAHPRPMRPKKKQWIFEWIKTSPMNYINFERRCNLLLKRKSSQTEQFAVFFFSFFNIILNVTCASRHLLCTKLIFITLDSHNWHLHDEKTNGSDEERWRKTEHWLGFTRAMHK